LPHSPHFSWWWQFECAQSAHGHRTDTSFEAIGPFARQRAHGTTPFAPRRCKRCRCFTARAADCGRFVKGKPAIAMAEAEGES
jgi:hypothetical protein